MTEPLKTEKSHTSENALEGWDAATLDERLAPLRRFAGHEAPAQGWARTIRQALGMTTQQLGRRMRLSRSGLHLLESTEGRGTIKLKNLRRLAEGLECDLVYALVPRRNLAARIEDRRGRLAADYIRLGDARLGKKELRLLAKTFSSAVRAARLWD